MTQPSSIERTGLAVEAGVPFPSELLELVRKTVDLEQEVAELYEQLREPVYRYLVLVFEDPAGAEDITQEAFLRLFRRLHSSQAVDNARFWLFRVAHNLALDVQKKNCHFTSVESLNWDEICRRHRDIAPNPEQKLLELEKYERVNASLGRLSFQESQCMHLRAEGFRHREIAAILEVSPSSVAEFLRRAIGKLMRDVND